MAPACSSLLPTSSPLLLTGYGVSASIPSARCEQSRPHTLLCQDRRSGARLQQRELLTFADWRKSRAALNARNHPLSRYKPQFLPSRIQVPSKALNIPVGRLQAVKCLAQSQESTVRPRLEPPLGLVRAEGALFLLYFMMSMSDQMMYGGGHGLILREYSSFQLLKILAREQRRRLAETKDLVTWVRELGWLVEEVKEGGGVIEAAITEALDAITPPGRQAFSGKKFREMADSYLRGWDEGETDIPVLGEGALLNLRFRRLLFGWVGTVSLVSSGHYGQEPCSALCLFLFFFWTGFRLDLFPSLPVVYTKRLVCLSRPSSLENMLKMFGGRKEHQDTASFET